MTTPTQVSAQNVNIEIEVGSTAQLSWGNNWARNVATAFTGTNSTVNAAEFRWGINFPGGYFFNSTRSVRYAFNDSMTIQGYNVTFVTPEFPGAAFSSAAVRILANGQIRMETDGALAFSKTWRTSGSSSDYSVIMELSSGNFNEGSDLGNVTYNLGSDRIFSVSARSPAAGTTSGDTLAFNDVQGIMTIRNSSSGVTIFTRPFYFLATAETISNL